VAKATRPSKVRSVGLAFVVGMTCAAGGYFVGKSNGTIEEKIASLMSSAKTGTGATQTAKSAPEAKPETRRMEPNAVKQTDKVELTHLVRTAAEPKPSTTPAPPRGRGRD
jgi:hypothetical protein